MGFEYRAHNEGASVMSTTTSKGYKKPDNGDRGSSFFPDLEFNIDRIDSHNHKGLDSETLDKESVPGLTAQILPAAWSLVSVGVYRALLTLPGSLEVDTTNISLRIGNRSLLSDTEKVTTNTFYVYTNDNTITVEVLYT